MSETGGDPRQRRLRLIFADRTDPGLGEQGRSCRVLVDQTEKLGVDRRVGSECR
jgi:hypothetical protein